MKLKHLLFLLLFSSRTISSFGQILHTESFAVILDTTKILKGNIVPDFKYQNLKEDLIEFENTTDISLKIKKSAITVANRLQLSKYGDNVLLSGGFLYVEYRKIFENKFVLEPFSQIHWSEARGLEFKYAGGINLRYRIYNKNKIGLFVGTGPFYEYENWNYNGVSDELLPVQTDRIINEKIKLGTYVSFKWKTNNKFDFDISLYHQGEFTDLVRSPRLASSSSVKYNLTEHLGLILQYQNIYDFNPVVPIDKLYNNLLFTIKVSF